MFYLEVEELGRRPMLDELLCNHCAKFSERVQKLVKSRVSWPGGSKVLKKTCIIYRLD